MHVDEVRLEGIEELGDIAETGERQTTVVTPFTWGAYVSETRPMRTCRRCGGDVKRRLRRCDGLVTAGQGFTPPPGKKRAMGGALPGGLPGPPPPPPAPPPRFPIPEPTPRPPPAPALPPAV